MRPKDTKKLPLGDDWVYQPKYDGTRSILITEPNDTKLINRRDVDKSRLYHELNFVHKEIGPGIMLDGEVVNITEDEPYGSFEGLSHRDRLKTTTPEVLKKYPLTFIAFDILKANNKDLTNKPLSYRDALMRRLLKRSKTVKLIKNFNEPPTKEMIKAHAEGIIAKDTNSSYKEGKTSKDWQKQKFTKEADLKVLGFTKGTGRRIDSFGAMKVGVQRHNKIVEVADVGTGFNDQQLKDIKKNPPKYARIKYRRIGSAGRLIEPRYLGGRNDIRDEDTHL
jgi:bifunctional non-homologous end joining protein LigD